MSQALNQFKFAGYLRKLQSEVKKLQTQLIKFNPKKDDFKDLDLIIKSLEAKRDELNAHINSF
jgi:hypothetical protein